MRIGSITTDIIANGLVFNMDAANRACYPRTGTTTTDTIGNINGSLTTTEMFNIQDITSFIFDGVDDFVDSNRTFSDTSFTISVWFKAGETSLEYIISTRTGSGGGSRGFVIKIEGNILYWDVYNAGQARVSTGFSDTTNWNHALMTYDGTTNKSYLNGLLIGTDNHSYLPSTANMAIGKYTFTTNFFKGNIGPVHIYNRALSSTEILHNYNALKGRFGLT